MRYFWCELAIVSAFMITFAVEFNSLTIINNAFTNCHSENPPMNHLL